ncbi:MAG: sodium:calcium antiporter [Halobacteriales archaeon]
MSRIRHPLAAVAATALLTLPWVGVFSVGLHHDLAPGVVVAISGAAVLGASFMLAWGAETAEKDVPRAFAIAVLAVLAVAPEYAVDALFAFNAGDGGATTQACATLSREAIEAAAEGGGSTLAAACHDANLAIANMTGANRILIGLGWSGIALFTIYKSRTTADPAVRDRAGALADAVSIDRDISLEIAFLFLATAWAFFVPLGGGIDLLDTFVLVGLYVAYIGVVLRGDVEEVEDQVGVPAYFHEKARRVRIPAAIALFLYSGVMIFIAVEPFAHGLEELGRNLGVPSFFMIQWIAPLASESPELIVVVYLVNKARSTAGFNALISSKLNQWTLLIGTIAVVYSIGLGTYGALPFDAKQSAEIWITAAQSFFALSILVNYEISVREAITLLVLFVSQVVIEFLILQVFAVANPEGLSRAVLIGYAVVYVLLGIALFARRRGAFRELFGRTRNVVREAAGKEPIAEWAD